MTFVVGDGFMLTRTPEDQESHSIPFHPRWHPYPLLRYGTIISYPWPAIAKPFSGQEQGYTGGSDPANREA